MSALKKCMSLLNKAKIDEGLSVDEKINARKKRNFREKHDGFVPTSNQSKSKDFMIHGKVSGQQKPSVRGVHLPANPNKKGQSGIGYYNDYKKQQPRGSDKIRALKNLIREEHGYVSSEAKKIKPKLVKCMDWLEKARVDDGLSHQDKVNARASRHDRVSMLSGKIKGSVSREKMEQGVHRPTSGKNYGFTESSRLGDLVRRKDGGAKLEIKGTHKRLKNIKPKLVKAMQWLEQNDLQKGENDELAFHAERARAAQSANKNAIAKEHFLAFLKLATEQCKIANSIWGMRSLFNKTLDYYLDLADTKLYSSNQGEIANGTGDAALVIYFKNGGKFENYKG